jgi:hypothetical protein
MRYLREAGLVTIGGRGITAATMTHEDAASLICSVYGAESVKDGLPSLLALKSLPASFQGTRRSRANRRMSPPYLAPRFLLGSEPSGGVVAGLSAALRLFGREEELGQQASEFSRRSSFKLGIRFSVQFPEHFASLTARVHEEQSEVWVYGRRNKPRTRQIRECDEEGLREIAKCLATP